MARWLPDDVEAFRADIAAGMDQIAMAEKWDVSGAPIICRAAQILGIAWPSRRKVAKPRSRNKDSHSVESRRARIDTERYMALMRAFGGGA